MLLLTMCSTKMAYGMFRQQAELAPPAGQALSSAACISFLFALAAFNISVLVSPRC